MKSLTMNEVKIDKDVEVALHQFLTFVEIFNAQLSVGCATIIILYDAVAHIYRITGLDMVEEVSHVEGNGGDVVVRM